MSRRHIITTAGLVSALIVLVATWWWLVPVQQGAVSGFLLTADQQAQRMLEKGNAAGAAGRFRDPTRQAAAFYRARDFDEAAAIWAGLDGAELAYNQGNALVMAGKYADAIARYDAALTRRPDWEAARENREIAVGRAERVKREGGEMTEGQLAPDEVVFNEGTSPSGGDSDQTEQVGSGLSDVELQAAWLRRVQTSPSDFLRAKFAYQRAVGEKAR